MILASSNARGETSQKQRTKMAPRYSLIHRIHWTPLVLILLALAYSLWQLDVSPPLFWDEGWTLMVARTWVEQGHYGRLLVGQPVSPRLSAAFPVVASVALSFRLFGVGIWQGRLVIVLYTLGALWLLYDLAARLYNRRIATGTLAAALLMSTNTGVHPLLVGRMVFAETPMLFFLLAGYVCFLLTLRRSVWLLPLAVVFWGLGLSTKLQALPFWALSLAIPLFIMLFTRRWRVASWLGVALIGSLGTNRLLSWLWKLVLGHQTMGGPLTPALISAVALVPVAHVRLAVLIVALPLGIPTMLGLANAAWKNIENRGGGTSSTDVVRWALLVLAGSWLAWYLLLSIGFPRYVFPATFVGSMFVAALLYDLTDGYRLSSTIKRAARALRRRGFNRQGLGALLAVVLLAWTVPATLYWLGGRCVANVDTSVQQVADFLNTRTAPDALIEGYSGEIFFLLDRRYHYPPDEVNVQIIRRWFWVEDVPIEYDPLTADPDYLVVCRLSRDTQQGGFFTWMIYDAVLESGAFRLLQVVGPYEVYERVR